MTPRLSVAFRRLLEAAFDDRLVRPEEAVRLRAQLADEPRLKGAKRRRLDELLGHNETARRGAVSQLRTAGPWPLLSWTARLM